MIRPGFLLLILAFLCGCQLLDRPRFNPSFTFEDPLVVQQDWNFRSNGDTYRFSALIEVGADGFRAAVMDTLGQRLFTLGMEEDSLVITEQQQKMSRSLQRGLVEALRLVFWSPTGSNGSVSQDWTVQQREQHRQVYYRDQLVARINYESGSPWRGSSRYTAIQEGIVLKIHSKRLQ